MRIHPAVLTLAVFTVSAAAQAHFVGPVSRVSDIPRLDVSAGYSHVLANAPPGISDDFGLNRGSVGVTYHFTPRLAATAQFTGGHANDISALGQNLTLLTYTAGPRYLYPRRRFVLFGQALFGLAHGSNSYFPLGTGYTTSDSSFAYSLGGGVDVNMTRHIAIRALDAQFLHTSLRNGSSNVQRHLVLGAGVVYKFGGRKPEAPTPPVAEFAFATPPRGDIHFSCSVDVNKINAGTTINILGNTMTEPDHLDVLYTWMPQAGMIEGTGREVKLSTSSLAPGRYVIRGHAAVVGDYAMAADCEMPFEITAPPVVAAAVVSLPVVMEPVDAPRQKEFHTNVPDAYFDYNSAAMRMDARVATTHAADFLNQHPDMRVRVEGFADERGSIEYNLMLGQQRAEAARNALIAAGVDPTRVEIVSFGKANAVCAQSSETCYQQNRRAAFSLHP